ncbi:MAG: Ig-like domain-containing protein [Candidatus Amulumruptor caecigallinarius]|nr:Ig-like domain-containing protein [Candidatus Amulumruptor caecigallinarius]MCM1397716.1 Ig-like domain-containing protein [Candidatus Amulumruptor caecigallinarius]MCM1454732.1 Ig-like domain-containing protein [bacterium]
MRKILSAVTLLLASAGFSAQAYNCPAKLYFYVSEATSSTAFEKNQTVFTYTVDATAADVYGVIVNANATSWASAHSSNGYFPSTLTSGNFDITGSMNLGNMKEQAGSANNQWDNLCLKFAKGNKYDIKLVHADGAFTGTVTVQGSEGGDTPGVTTTGYVVGKEYFIDSSPCSWFLDGNAIIKVWDGAKDVVAENIGGGMLKWIPTAAGTEGIAYVKRVDPKNESTVWNEYGMKVSSNAEDNLFTLSSDFKGGSWSTYATPDAWIISKAINGWSADAKSDYVMTLDETTGIYSIAIDPAKLRAEGADNGFKFGYGALKDWENYFGSVSDGSAVTVANGIAIPAVKNGNNFAVPEAATNPVTLTLDIKKGEITASWKNEVVDPDDPIGPVESDDLLLVSIPQMDVNGSTTVEVTLQAPEDKEYCGASFSIMVPAGFAVSDLALNRDRCADHKLVTNPEDLSTPVTGEVKCTIYSAKNTPFTRAPRPIFSFKLTATNASVGEVSGKLTNIIFNEVPSEGNLNVGNKFEDTPLNITVVKAVTSIEATPSNLNLTNGASGQINLTILPEDATNKEVKWEIESGENVITLSEDGTVIATASGVAVIKVTALDGFGATTTIDVTVDGKPVEAITISATESTMYIGEELQLTATVTPDDATNKAVMWVSSDYTVATVDSEGLVKGVGAGVAVITAIARGGVDVEATCTVTVKAKVSGDADGDDVLTIADIVLIAKKSVGIQTEEMHLENMDMDRDGNITSTDVVLAVYYLNKQDATIESPETQRTTNKLRVTSLVPVSENSFNLPIYLPMAKDVAGLKFDVVLPEGLELTADSYISPEAGNGHDVAINKVGDNTWRVIIYSPYNFKANNIGYLNIANSEAIEGRKDMYLNNVTLSDGSGIYATDDDVHTIDVIVTSIESVFADGADARHDVYNVAGALVARQADKARVATLPAGIYLVGGQKVAKF